MSTSPNVGVGYLVGLTFSSTFGSLPVLARIFSIPIAMNVLLGGARLALGEDGFLLTALGELFNTVLYLAAAVSLHRLIVHNEPPPAMGFRLGKRLWRYLGVSALCGLLVAGPLVALAMGFAMIGPNAQLIGPLTIPVAVYFSVRLMPALPAAAAGGVTGVWQAIRLGYQMSAGRFWLLFLGILSVALVGLILAIFAVMLATVLPKALTILLVVLAQTLSSVLVLSLLSHAWITFSGEPPDPVA